MQPKAYSYIRFSTPEQERGDSLRRQIAKAERYCQEHGLTLDDSLRFEDRGVSAFRGEHRVKGALGEFLRLVKEGKVPPGSVLIVESLDRLSREGVLAALRLFMDIVGAGIRLVTLHDKQEYTGRDWMELMRFIVILQRAREESEIKSMRLSEAWVNKRAVIVNGRKLTARAPAWIRLSEDRKRFIIIPEAAKTIERIFHMKLEGRGTGAIERELNADPSVWQPPKRGPKRTGGWRKSYIAKILKNRAVIGEFQPHKKTGRRREPVGDPIPNYYPPIIDEELFYRVQARIKENAQKSGRGGGRTGKAKNLFTHVVKCGLCGYPMHFVDKGRPPKGRRYLHCDGSRRLKVCTAKPICYEEFERLVLCNLEELDISQLMPGGDEIQARMRELENKITANRERLLEIGDEVENLSDIIARTKDHRVQEQLEQRLIRAFDERERIEGENEVYEQEMNELRCQREEIQGRVDNAREIYSLLQSTSGDEKREIELRLHLRQQIQRLIEWIKVYPLQEPYQPIKETEEVGVVKVMHSRYIDKVRIKFRGSRNLRILYLNNYAELVG